MVVLLKYLHTNQAKAVKVHSQKNACYANTSTYCILNNIGKITEKNFRQPGIWFEFFCQSSKFYCHSTSLTALLTTVTRLVTKQKQHTVTILQLYWKYGFLKRVLICILTFLLAVLHLNASKPFNIPRHYFREQILYTAEKVECL